MKLRIFLVIGVALVVGAGSAAQARVDRSAVAPNFAVPAQLPPATVGQLYTYFFCRPQAATANGVCGSLKVPSTNPNGGSGPPYAFLLKWQGFHPTGLAFSNRTGILTGTIADTTRAGNYPFSLCAFSNHGGTNTCHATVLPVIAAPAPAPSFAGTWTGGFTSTSNRSDCPGTTLPNAGGATVTIAQNGTSYTVTLQLAGFVQSLDLTNGCAVTSKQDATLAATVNPFTTNSLSGQITTGAGTGTPAGSAIVLTLNGANTIAATITGGSKTTQINANRSG